MFLYRLVGFVGWLLDLYAWIIIASALISWVSPDPYNPIVQTLRRLTEPVLRPIRRVLSPYQAGLDFSPLVAILVILFVERVILPSLASLF